MCIRDSSRSIASIHAEVPNDCNVERTHESIDRIEREAMRRLGILLVSHIDPVETHDERVVECKELVTSVLEGIDSRLTFHDFRMVDGVERINLIFDLVAVSYTHLDVYKRQLLYQYRN